MIQTFHYQVPVDATDVDVLVEGLRSRLSRLTVQYRRLRGVTIDIHDDHLMLKLRVAGHNRWRISSDARDILLSMLRRAGGDWRHTQLLLVETEPTLRNLTLETGRQPRESQGKGSRRGSRAWDHIEWQGEPVL